MAEEPKLLHKLLPQLRKAKGLSQSGLSHRTAILEGKHGREGVPEATIHSYEKSAGRGTVPSARTLRALAAALGVEPDVFYEWPLAEAKEQRPARGAATQTGIAKAKGAAAKRHGRRRASPPNQDARDEGGA